MQKMEKQEDTIQTYNSHSQLDRYVALAQNLLKDLILTEGCECQSMFNSQTEPHIEIATFIKRIHRYTQFSPQCLILAIIYLDRYNMANSQFSLNHLNVHKIYLTCILLATKFHDDFYYDNKAFQLAGGVSTPDLFRFQVQLYTRINFEIHVKDEDFKALLEKLEDVYGSNHLILQ